MRRWCSTYEAGASQGAHRLPAYLRPQRMNALEAEHCSAIRLEQIMLRLLQSSQDVAEGTTAFAHNNKYAPSFTGTWP